MNEQQDGIGWRSHSAFELLAAKRNRIAWLYPSLHSMFSLIIHPAHADDPTGSGESGARDERRAAGAVTGGVFVVMYG
jgi:hypothetical protein